MVVRNTLGWLFVLKCLYLKLVICTLNYGGKNLGRLKIKGGNREPPLKVGVDTLFIYSVFTASLLGAQHKRVSVEIGRQVCLLCPWSWHLPELPLPLSSQTGSNRWQLDSKSEKVTSLSPGRGTLTNKWVLKPKPGKRNSSILT